MKLDGKSVTGLCKDFSEALSCFMFTRALGGLVLEKLKRLHVSGKSPAEGDAIKVDNRLVTGCNWSR